MVFVKLSVCIFVLYFRVLGWFGKFWIVFWFLLWKKGWVKLFWKLVIIMRLFDVFMSVVGFMCVVLFLIIWIIWILFFIFGCFWLFERLRFMIELIKLIIVEVCEGLKVKDYMLLELMDVFFGNIEKVNDKLNVYVVVMVDKVCVMVKVFDEKLVVGIGGVLEGILFGIKDLFGIEGVYI